MPSPFSRGRRNPLSKNGENMKKIFVAVALALICVLSAPVCAQALGEGVFHTPKYEQKLAEGVSYKEAETTVNGKVQNLYYGEFKPSNQSDYEWVIYNKSASDGKLTLATVMDIAKDFEAKTNRKVYLAVNGDYFAGGQPVESYVADGVVLGKGAYVNKHCFGFDNNGKAVVGRMTETKYRLDVTFNGVTESFYTDKLNVAPQEDGIGIYTIPGTYTVENAGKYRINIDENKTQTNPVEGESRRMTDGSLADNESFTVKSSQFWVVAKGKAAAYCFDNIKYGAVVSYTETPAGDFDGCSWVVGGYDILVNNGVANTNCHTDNNGNSGAPRTFIGAKADGTMFVCVDNGPTYGGSITVNQEAQLALGLGAKYALELDGGGSSTMIIRQNDALVLRNVPTDGGMRKVAQAVMIVEKEKKTEDVNPGGNQGENQGNQGNQGGTANNGGSVNNPQKPLNKTVLIAVYCAAGVALIAVVAVICVKRFGKKGDGNEKK